MCTNCSDGGVGGGGQGTTATTAGAEAPATEQDMSGRAAVALWSFLTAYSLDETKPQQSESRLPAAVQVLLKLATTGGVYRRFSQVMPTGLSQCTNPLF